MSESDQAARDDTAQHPQQPGLVYPQHQPPPPGGYQIPMGARMIPPTQGIWMMPPQGIPNCPPGLEYLTMIDQLLIKQKIELLESFIGYEGKNKYAIKNSMGQVVYMAFEESGCLARECFTALRPFDLKILDNAQNEVIHLYRPLACDSCCPCCPQSIDVFAPPGQLVGRVKQNFYIFMPEFSIENAAGDTVFKIHGPYLACGCGDVDFKIRSPDGTTEVGKISKQWSGFTKEYFTDADNFGVTFPMDLDVRMKAVMLGAVFLIDFMFFERNK